jgi:hypothetical protein
VFHPGYQRKISIWPSKIAGSSDKILWPIRFVILDPHPSLRAGRKIGSPPEIAGLIANNAR